MKSGITILQVWWGLFLVFVFITQRLIIMQTLYAHWTLKVHTHRPMKSDTASQTKDSEQATYRLLRAGYLQTTPNRLLADTLRTGYLQSIKLEPVYSKGHQDCKDSLKAPRKLQPKPQENSRNPDQERDKLGSLHQDGEPIKTAFQANEY